MRNVIWMTLFVSALIACPHTAEAQELRIYTRLYNHEEDSTKPVVASRSLSLFHAGKTYDYIDTLGEVTIFEPVKNRFHILDTKRALATTVDFAEVRQLLKMARDEAEGYLAELDQADSAESVREPLRFQLSPVFDEKFDEKKERLTLTGAFVKYEVQCTEDADSDAIEAYLQYADWMCRLNYLLHPSAMLPESRLSLNAALRRHAQMPVEVELEADCGTRIHLTARHQISWKLDAKDRSMIHRWEKMLADKQTRHVSFREYQRAVLGQ